MGGWNDPTETVIGGTGELYVGATGTALPANEGTALNAAFNGLGYHSEDGVSISNAPDIVSLGAWQSKSPIRRIRDNETFRLTAALLQWNEISTPLAFGGGAISDLGSGHYKYTPPDSDDAPDEKAFICDVVDGTNKLRIVVPRGTVVESVETQFSRAQFGMLPITIEALEPDDGTPPWHFLTNLAAMATGS